MCSTIRPQKRAHYFRFWSTKHFCNAAASSFHQHGTLVDLVIVAQRSRPSKCARLSSTIRPPKKRARCFGFFSTKHFRNAPASSFHENVILVDLVIVQVPAPGKGRPREELGGRVPGRWPGPLHATGGCGGPGSPPR